MADDSIAVDCPHVRRIARAPSSVQKWEDVAAPTARCTDCDSTLSPWLCLTCGEVHCGRYVKGHAQDHYRKSGHPLAMDAAAGLIHCYECDDFVPDSSLTETLRSMRGALEAVLARNSKREAEEQEAETAKKAKMGGGGTTVVINGVNGGKRRINLREAVGTVGLRNLGNTCYMNSVLQALSNTKELREYFLRSYKPSTASAFESDEGTRTRSSNNAVVTGPRLADEYYRLMKELWQPQSTAVAPHEFLAALWRLVPTFRGHQQQDAQELLRYALEAIHADVVPSVPSNVGKTKAEERTSIVTDVFGGSLWNEVTCLVCKTVSYKEDPFLDLSLDIEEAGDSKHISLDDCLRFFTRVEELEDSERYLCEKCGVRQRSTKKFSIRQNPRVLCIQFKRFRWGTYTRSKVKDAVSFPVHHLDLTPYMDPRSPKARRPPVYDLYAVVIHHGSGLGSGHYTTMSYSDALETWLTYDDSTVSPAAVEDVCAAQAYLLFYHLK